jgi:hypothetical protein
MCYRQSFSTEDHADPRPWAYVKVQARQHSSKLPDDPPAVFVSGPFMAIKFDQAGIGIAKLDQLESLPGDPEMFFDLGAVYGMRKN